MPQNNQKLFSRLWRIYLKKHWPLVLLAFLLMAVEGSTLGALSYMLEPMFDEVFVAGRSDMVWLVGAGICGLFALRAITGVSQRILMAIVGFRASSDLQKDLLAHTLTLDTAFFNQHPPGQLIERVQGDVVTLQNIWSVLLMGAGREVVALISLLAVAISVDPIWTLVAAVGTPLLLLPSIVVQKYIRRKGHTLREIAGKRTTRLDEIFHGITPIKLNRMEAYQQSRFNRATDENVTASIQSQAGHAIVPGLVDIAVGLGFLSVMIYGGHQIIEGEKTIGQFMSFFTAMTLAFQPLRKLAGIAGAYQNMMASLERIYWLFDQEPAIKTTTRATRPPKLKPYIQFKNVHLSYGDNTVLKNLSFTANIGETTALIGLSGAGKSTVFNTLTRLVDPQSGSIKIGGQEINALPLSELRDMFGVVTQETLLFDETLRENIALDKIHLTDAELKDALETAHAAEFIEKLPNGLDTQAGPRGSNLSGGQRQRVAIARAILRDAPILLLDEATSALDAQSEVLVQKALENIAQSKTTLVIAHRLSTIKNADKILVMEEGQVVAQGTHEELLKQGGLYAKLIDLQDRKDVK